MTASRDVPAPAPHDARAEADESTVRRLDGYLARLRAELDRVDELRAGFQATGASAAVGSRVAAVLQHLAELQRVAGQAIAAAVGEARDAETTGAPVATPGAERTGERASPRRAPEAPTRPAPAPQEPTSGVAQLVERELDRVAEHLRAAIADYEALERIRESADDPELAGCAAAHRQLTLDRWREALGARAQLEALYQQFAGVPSPQHAASTQLLADADLPPNPVGLTGRHPDTAAFLRDHVIEPADQLAAPRPESVGRESGREL